MAETPPVKQLFDIRVKELYAMKKAELIPILRQLSPNSIWHINPPEKWKKEELISEILQKEGLTY